MNSLDSLLSDFAQFDETAARRLADQRERAREEIAERAAYLAARVEYTDEALDDATRPDGGHFRGGYRARIVSASSRGRRFRDVVTETWRTPALAAEKGASYAARLNASIVSVTVERAR